MTEKNKMSFLSSSFSFFFSSPSPLLFFSLSHTLHKKDRKMWPSKKIRRGQNRLFFPFLVCLTCVRKPVSPRDPPALSRLWANTTSLFFFFFSFFFPALLCLLGSAVDPPALGWQTGLSQFSNDSYSCTSRALCRTVVHSLSLVT